MPSVRLGRYEVEHGTLPPICMACGAPAVVYKKKRFAWHPQWVWVLLLAGLLPLIIVAAILTKRMTVAVPFCENHRSYFLWRNVLLPLSLLFLVILGCAGLFLTTDLEKKAGWAITPIYLLSYGVCFLAWFIFAAVVGERSIRPTEITDRSITLRRVSEQFAQAIEKSRMARPAEDIADVLPADPRFQSRGGPEQFYDPKR